MERLGKTSLIRLFVVPRSSSGYQEKEIVIRAAQIKEISCNTDGFANLLMDDGRVYETSEMFEDLLAILKNVPGL